jgi:hypothetical protein
VHFVEQSAPTVCQDAPARTKVYNDGGAGNLLMTREPRAHRARKSSRSARVESPNKRPGTAVVRPLAPLIAS